jgi:hypothetical protein
MSPWKFPVVSYQYSRFLEAIKKIKSKAYRGDSDTSDGDWHIASTSFSLGIGSNGGSSPSPYLWTREKKLAIEPKMRVKITNRKPSRL